MAVLEIEFKGIDGASTVINNITAEVKETGEASEKAGQQGKGFFGGMLEAASGFLAAGVIQNIASSFGSFIQGGMADAREANILMGQTEAVIKSTGAAAGVTAEHVADYASSLSAAAGQSLFGDDQIQQSENLLLTFTNIKDKTLDAATAISVDMAQALGGAPKDSAIQLGKALNDPVAGITALTRVGVTFTDQQKDQIKALQESGDMAGAQAVILAELNKEFGGSAKAAAEADGGMAQLNDQMGEAAETMGGALLPIVKMFAGFAAENLMPILVSVITKFGDEMPAMIEKASAVFNTIVEALRPVAAFLADVFTNQAPADLSVFNGVLADAQHVVEDVLGAIQSVVSAVLPVVLEFWKENGADIMATVKGAFDQVIAIIRLALQLYDAIVPPVLRAIAGFITAHKTEIVTIITVAWDVIKTIVNTVLGVIQTAIRVALQLVQGDFSGAWNTIKEGAQQWFNDLSDTFSNVGPTLKRGLDEAVRLAKEALGDLVENATSIGKSMIDGIISGLENARGALMDWLKDLASDALKAVKHALGIESPSKVFAAEVGAPIAQGIAVGILQGAGQVSGALTTITGPRALAGAAVGAGYGAGAGSGSMTVNAPMTINAAPGQSPQQIGKATLSQLRQQTNMRR